MPVERREQAIAVEIGSTGVIPGGTRMFNGRRQPSRGGTSRMTRECQVRICERLGVKFPGPTRQSRRFRDGRGWSALPPILTVTADILDGQLGARSTHLGVIKVAMIPECGASGQCASFQSEPFRY